ncbi:MAG: Mur ligase family protein, partial [Rubripirellula sp.]
MRHGINRSNKLVNHLAGDIKLVDSDSFESSKEFAAEVESGSSDSISLRRVLPSARFFAGDDVVFSAIATTPESANEGDLIVYRIGEADPAKLVATALARGAVGILTEQVLPCPLPQCIVGDIEPAMAAITAEQLEHPDRKLLTVGVIGSAGKTTTSLLVSSLLRSMGMRTAYQTDLGESDGVLQSTSSDSLPSGTALVELLGESCDGQCQASIIELRDDDARHGCYDAIEFDVLIVTGSASAADDFGPSGLQCALDRLSSKGVVVAPVDDAKAMQVLEDNHAKVVTYGVRKPADLSVKIIEQSGGMTTLLVSYHDITAVMETTLCGAGMAGNHAAAILTGLLLDQPLQDVIEKVSQLHSVPGRGQRLSDLEHATVVIDAGGSPDRAATALRTHRSMKAAGRLWCVLAIDGKEAPEVLAQYGNHLERFADHPVIASQRDAKTSFLAGTHGILDGVEKCAAFRLVADRARAIDWAITEAAPNDTVLII